jgi:hypothetical protein
MTYTTVPAKPIERLVSHFSSREQCDTFAAVAAAMDGLLSDVAVTGPDARAGEYAVSAVSAVLAGHLRSGQSPTALLVQGIASIAAAHAATRVVRCGDRCGEHRLQ